MKKNYFRLVLAAAAVFIVLASCEKKQPGAVSVGDSLALAGGEITVRLLTDQTGIDDKSFNAAAWRGILEYYGDTWNHTTKRGIAYDVVAAQSQDMFVPNLRQATDEGYDLIIATGFTWAAAVQEVAADNPRQNYLIVDIKNLQGGNIMQAAYAEHEASYLVGVAAALKAKEDGIAHPRFGFIGGIPGGTITKFEVGFIQGVHSIIPDAGIIDYYVNSWSEPALAKTQAKNWYDSGVYTIFSAAGSSGNGTIAQAKEYRAAGKNVWAIGVDSDQHEEGMYTTSDSAVLTSMLKRVETSVMYALEAVKNKTFRGEVIVFDLAREGVGYSTANPALSNNIVTQLDALRQRIISGDLQVAATYAQAKLLSGFPQNLKAVDD